MQVCFRSFGLVSGGVMVGLLATLPATAQSCQDSLHQDAARQTSSTVSVADLRIPHKACQHFEKARAAGEAGRTDVFEREADLALAAAPAFTQVYLLRAARQLDARQFDAVIETIAAARRIRPELPWSGIVLASALAELHRYNEAAAEMDRVRGPEADSWQANFERAREAIARRDVAGALHWSELALAASPSGCIDAHLLRANALQIAGRSADAIVQMEAYLASNQPLPQRAEVLQVLEHTRARMREGNATLLAAKLEP